MLPLNYIFQAFVKASEAFSGRPTFPLLENLKNGNGLVFLDYGDKHKSQRKFGLMTLRELVQICHFNYFANTIPSYEI